MPTRPPLATASDLRKQVRALPRSNRPTFPVSVNLIVKNCAKPLEACLKSLSGFVGDKSLGDEIVIVDTGSTDKTTKQVARLFGARLIERPDLSQDVRPLIDQWLPEWRWKWESETQNSGGMILDFAEARNLALDMSRNDCVFWIDSDDTLVEESPGVLRYVVEKGFRQKYDCLFLDYDYAFDQHDKKCITRLKRERVVDRKLFRWVGACHETLIPNKGTEPRTAFYQDVPVKIAHTSHRVDHRRADVRNYLILRNSLRHSDDVRTHFYLGNACRGLGRPAEAVEFYRTAIRRSGSKDDAYAARMYITQIFLTPPWIWPSKAANAALECIKANPLDPRGYYLASRAYAAMDRWAESLQMFRAGRNLQPVDTTHTDDPEQTRSFPLQVAIKACIELKRLDEAQPLAAELLQVRPDFPDTLAVIGELNNAMVAQKMFEGVQTLMANMPDKPTGVAALRGMVDKMKIVPTDLEKLGMSNGAPLDPRPPAAKEVVIWCGHTHEAWGPKNRKTGISGSEKMVLLMAPRLAARGCRVTVYANVPHGQRGVDRHGVRWLHWAQLRPAEMQPVDVVIVWRQIQALNLGIPAKKIVFWGHDVQSADQWKGDEKYIPDELWLLSESHATPLRAVPELNDKIVVTRNAIDSPLFKLATSTKRRDPKSVVFCSDVTRGAQTAIRAFRCADVEGAKLHISYGFSPLYFGTMRYAGHMTIPDLGKDEWLEKYTNDLLTLIEYDPALKYHGRLSWSKQTNLMRRSGVWLYPTRFIETSCMSAMEAQAAGCCILTSKVGALRETVMWDHKLVWHVNPDDAIGTAKALNEAMAVPADDPLRHTLSERALDRFGADQLADSWVSRF